MKKLFHLAFGAIRAAAYSVGEKAYLMLTMWMHRQGLILAASPMTLTGLIPDVYEAMDIVSRELTGLIPAVNMNNLAERAAVGQTITSFETPASAAVDITPAVTPPDSGGQTIAPKNWTITKSRMVPLQWTGNEQRKVNTSFGYTNIRAQQVAQGLRTLVNEVEADIAALYKYASRAYGTAGTTPFASTLTDSAQARKILADNGAPLGDMQMVFDTTAGANVRTLSNLTRANEGGTDMLLRQGELLNVHGFSMRESAQILTPAAGAMAGATTNAAGYAKGATVITLATAGTGVVAAGDIITFAGDTNKYVVSAVNFAGANPAAGDTITIQSPGLRIAIPAAATAITVVGAAARNMFFDRNAIWLATAAPEAPQEGDSAADVQLVTDPRTGITFELRLYAGYRQVHYEIGLAWGTGAAKEAHIGLLLG